MFIGLLLPPAPQKSCSNIILNFWTFSGCVSQLFLTPGVSSCFSSVCCLPTLFHLCSSCFFSPSVGGAQQVESWHSCNESTLLPVAQKPQSFLHLLTSTRGTTRPVPRILLMPLCFPLLSKDFLHWTHLALHFPSLSLKTSCTSCVCLAKSWMTSMHTSH